MKHAAPVSDTAKDARKSHSSSEPVSRSEGFSVMDRLGEPLQARARFLPREARQEWSPPTGSGDRSPLQARFARTAVAANRVAGRPVVQRVKADELFKQVRALVRQGKNKQALSLIRESYDPQLGNSDEYDFGVVRRLEDIPGEQSTRHPPGGAMGATAPAGRFHRKPTVYVTLDYLRRTTGSFDEFGNLISTLQHEFTHVGQFNADRFRSGLRAGASEFEAYASELQSALTIQDSGGGDEDLPPMPSKDQLVNAYANMEDEWRQMSALERQPHQALYDRLLAAKRRLAPDLVQRGDYLPANLASQRVEVFGDSDSDEDEPPSPRSSPSLLEMPSTSTAAFPAGAPPIASSSQPRPVRTMAPPQPRPAAPQAPPPTRASLVGRIREMVAYYGNLRDVDVSDLDRMSEAELLGFRRDLSGRVSDYEAYIQSEVWDRIADSDRLKQLVRGGGIRARLRDREVPLDVAVPVQMTPGDLNRLIFDLQLEANRQQRGGFFSRLLS